MGRDDGDVTGVTKILDGGLDQLRYNLVLLADGFTDSEQVDFADACQEILDAMTEDAWFRHLVPALNVFRVDVESDQSGTDDPEDCGGSGDTQRTFFDSSMCTGWPDSIRRLMHCDEGLVCDVCDEQVPLWDSALLIVNTDLRGGKGSGSVSIVTTAYRRMGHVALHEMGHTIFGLADEYAHWRSNACGPGEEPDREDPWPGLEPWSPNITRARVFTPFPNVASSPEGVKWGHLIRAEDDDLPSMENPDCTRCPSEEVEDNPDSDGCGERRLCTRSA